MIISFDPEKRAWTLRERGLDFARAGEVFAAPNLTTPDERFDYGESRMITIGRLDGRMVLIVWTEREDGRRIISMRKTNEREQRKFSDALG